MPGPRAGRATGCARAATRRGPKRLRVSRRRRLEAESFLRREKGRGHFDPERRVDLERDADGHDPHFARVARTVATQQAGLGQAEGNGRVRLHSWSVGDTGVRVETRRQVDGYDPSAGRVDTFDPLGEFAL